MRHLTNEDMARLVDEAPTPDERRHLATCRRCVAELDALREQTEALSSLPDLRPPAGDWRELERRLAREGLVKERPAARTSGPVGSPGWLQAAAALILFLGGAGTGAALARVGGPEATAGADVAAVDAGSAEEAVRILDDAEERYVNALVQYRRLSGTGSEERSGAVDPASRFAALEALVAAGQAAVRQAPTDPFINGVLVNSMAERQATLRQISTAGTDNWF